MARQKLANVLQLTHPRDGIPHPTRFKVGQRQRQDMAEQLRAQAHINPIRRMGKQVGAESAERRIEDCKRDHADRQYMQGSEPFVHKHLVDDDLREQRRQQRKQLQEERGDQDFA